MLAWVIDLLAVSALLGFSALLVEPMLRSRHGPTRVPWLVALAASLLVPLLGSWMGVRSWVTHRATAVTRAEAARPDDVLRLSPWVDLGMSSSAVVNRKRTEQWVLGLWGTSTAYGGLTILAGAWQLRRQRRRWRTGVVAGVPVLIAADAGPAVFGYVRPRIVVPEWLVTAPPETQRYVMAHEQSHLEAGDSRLLVLSAVLVLVAAWNPLLWWQARRLRRAIEIDCDRRVLRNGVDVQRYAAVLMQFGLRRAGPMGAVAPISESPSTLERRITVMFQPKNARWTLASLALALLSMGSVAAATRFTPPPLMLAAATALAEATPLDRYVGRYEFASVTVLEIRRQQDRLSAAFPDAPADLLTAQGTDAFRYENLDVTIRFQRDAAGQVTGLSFEQNGAITLAPRIAPARVHAIQDAIAERYRRQLADPRSEPVLRRLVAGLQSGSPDYAMLSPQMAGGTRTQLKGFQSSMGPFGPIQSMEFKGVNKAGWDEYEVKHLHGTAHWQIALDDRGIVVGALVHSDS